MEPTVDFGLCGWWQLVQVTAPMAKGCPATLPLGSRWQPVQALVFAAVAWGVPTWQEVQ